jgi:lysophospholipase L1-like esterase
MNRREFLRTTAVAVATTTAAARPTAAQSRPAATTKASAGGVPDNLTWYDVREWGVEGRGFDDTEQYYDRLPARAKGVVRAPVWSLARDTSGMLAQFDADTPAVYVRYRLTRDTVAMPHMPATGVSGVDLYAQESPPLPATVPSAGTRPASVASNRGTNVGGPAWFWLGTSRPTARDVGQPLVAGIAPGRHRFRAYLPLYNGVERIEIGLPPGAPFAPVAPRAEKPVLFYGTSVTQGACASRAGTSFVNLLGRRLDRPMLNLGFSGNGTMEIEVGRFLAELDPAVFVFDCLTNTTLEQVKARAEPLVKLFKSRHPDTPVLFLEERTYTNAPLLKGTASGRAARRAAYRRAFDNLVQSGLTGLHYLPENNFLGTDTEGAVDGSHPNDLGMMRYADALEPTLRQILA